MRNDRISKLRATDVALVSGFEQNRRFISILKGGAFSKAQIQKILSIGLVAMLVTNLLIVVATGAGYGEPSNTACRARGDDGLVACWDFNENNGGV